MLHRPALCSRVSHPPDCIGYQPAYDGWHVSGRMVPVNIRVGAVKRLLIAAACSLLAFTARLSLDPLLGSSQAYAFALGSVALSIYLAGSRFGIVSALLSAVWVNYFYVIPRYEFDDVFNVPILASLVSYFIIAGILIYFGTRAERALTVTQRALEAADGANEALRAADKQKDEFISVLSHELRNPLGAISNAAIVIRQRSHHRDLQPAVELQYRQLQQMRRLLDDLLDVARINRGLINVRRETQDVRLCVQNAIDANMHLIEAAQQSLVAVLPDEPVIAFVDGPRVTQVVSNLLNNAIKYAGPGVCIEARVERRHGSVAITVSDNGRGIDPALLPQLFERFHAVAKEPGIQGLGLGLWISQRLASIHGGRITATSEGLGKGAQFSIFLPDDQRDVSAE